MKYYDILKISTSASQMEIDRAYQKLIKEARYDTSINRKEIEIAYRMLRDPTQRAAYDFTLAEERKKAETTAKIRKQKSRQSATLKLAIVAGVLLLVTVTFFAVRYGYHFRSFSPGDVLYYNDKHTVMGTIVREEKNHSFGGVKKDAFLIKKGEKEMWLPVDDVKARCYSD